MLADIITIKNASNIENIYVYMYEFLPCRSNQDLLAPVFKWVLKMFIYIRC